MNEDKLLLGPLSQKILRGEPLLPSTSDSPVYGIMDPDYARWLSKARCIAKQEGYALAVHGSFTRDLDVIAVPWTPEARKPINLIARLEAFAGLSLQSKDATVMNHGRLQWTFLFPEFGDPRFIDFSVIPPTVPQSRHT